MTDKVIGVEETRSALAALPKKIEEGAKVAASHTGIFIERRAKEYLKAKVYSKPEGSYHRTGTLIRSVHAAEPSRNHEGDQATARGGTDLAATDTEGLAEEQDSMWLVQAGTWLDYGAIVEKRAPWLIPAAQDGEAFYWSAMQKEVSKRL